MIISKPTATIARVRIAAAMVCVSMPLAMGLDHPADALPGTKQLREGLEPPRAREGDPNAAEHFGQRAEEIDVEDDCPGACPERAAGSDVDRIEIGDRALGEQVDDGDVVEDQQRDL